MKSYVNINYQNWLLTITGVLETIDTFYLMMINKLLLKGGKMTRYRHNT